LQVEYDSTWLAISSVKRKITAKNRLQSFIN
jgi:hypothetical protein